MYPTKAVYGRVLEMVWHYSQHLASNQCGGPSYIVTQDSFLKYRAKMPWEKIGQHSPYNCIIQQKKKTSPGALPQKNFLEFFGMFWNDLV